MTDPILQIFLSLLVFAGVYLLIYAVFRHPVPAEAPVHRRFAAAVGQQRNTMFEQPTLAPLMGLGLTLARRLSVPHFRRRIRQSLNAAGNPSGYSVEEYLAICLLSAAGCALAAALVLLWIGSSLAAMFAPLAGLAGFYLPLWALDSTAKARLVRISKQLPYTLDLISLTMGAGAAFSEAIETLIRDDPDQDLNQELAIVLSEMRFGATLSNAMENMAERIPLQTLRSVVAAVVQSQKLGTTLSIILKDQADMMRTHRSVRAEKLSASASLRILVPSMVILLAVVIVVFGPVLVRFFTDRLW
ncbi:MAG: type II secretion system F family protein [Phycisphaeraceae bacterium]|nr:type II secretion system F family protein [Phycisphaeraceae bacterium]